MRGDEFEKIRSQLCVSRRQMLELLGRDKSKNNFDLIGAYESDKKPITTTVGRLVWLILEYRDATGNLPKFPDVCDEEPNHG